jgi:hypothetical protein
MSDVSLSPRVYGILHSHNAYTYFIQLQTRGAGSPKWYVVLRIGSADTWSCDAAMDVGYDTAELACEAWKAYVER